MSTRDEVAGRTWAEMIRVVALLRVAVGTLDRLLGRSCAGTVHPELLMGLVESSTSAQRALVMLAEARQTLADHFPRLPLLDTVTDGATAEPAYRREDE